MSASVDMGLSIHAINALELVAAAAEGVSLVGVEAGVIAELVQQRLIRTTKRDWYVATRAGRDMVDALAFVRSVTEERMRLLGKLDRFVIIDEAWPSDVKALTEDLESLELLFDQASQGRHDRDGEWIIPGAASETLLQDVQRVGFKVKKVAREYWLLVRGELQAKLTPFQDGYLAWFVMAEQRRMLEGRPKTLTPERKQLIQAINAKLNLAFKKSGGFAPLADIDFTMDELEIISKYAQQGKHGPYLTIRSLEQFLRREGGMAAGAKGAEYIDKKREMPDFIKDVGPYGAGKTDSTRSGKEIAKIYRNPAFKEDMDMDRASKQLARLGQLLVESEQAVHGAPERTLEQADWERSMDEGAYSVSNFFSDCDSLQTMLEKLKKAAKGVDAQALAPLRKTVDELLSTLMAAEKQLRECDEIEEGTTAPDYGDLLVYTNKFVNSHGKEPKASTEGGWFIEIGKKTYTSPTMKLKQAIAWAVAQAKKDGEWDETTRIYVLP